MKQITLGCGTVLTLDQLEDAGISFVPCGQVDGKDQPVTQYAHLLKAHRQVTRQTYGKKWYGQAIRNANGLQLMTGSPTFRPAPGKNFYYYTSLDIEKRMREEHPGLVDDIIKIYSDGITGTPCEIETKSGGVRLDCYSLYLGKKIPFQDDSGMLFEILAGGSLVRLDGRYQMKNGSVLDLPVMENNTPLQEIHAIGTSIATKPISTQSKRKVVETSQIGNLDIEWSETTIEKDGKQITLQVSQYFETEHCPNHHDSNRLEVRFTKYPNGSIDGICWNCGERWYEVEPPRKKLNKEWNGDNANAVPFLTQPSKADIERLIAQAPVYINEAPSFRHWTSEDRTLIKACGYNPDASYHFHNNEQIPTWIPSREKLHTSTGLFKDNGQPKHIDTHRVWYSLLKHCDTCNRQTKAFWIDRFSLTAGEYCDTCHVDEQTHSYLNIELNRKLKNNFHSTSEGFIGHDPFWNQNLLWENEQILHLGAAMGLGKTTIVSEKGISWAQDEDIPFIICVPRISLALNIATKLNKQFGKDAFGIWYENSRYKFIGKIGAVCTLTSLPQIYDKQDENEPENWITPEESLIFIDEIDFSYPLTALVTPQAITVKNILRQALQGYGLVTAGQTEYTSVIEALADELETDKIHGYYKYADTHERELHYFEYADIPGKETNALGGFCKGIQDGLDAEHTIYGFCSERRQTDVAKKMFKTQEPLVYSALSKHSKRNHALLENRKISDTQLFLGTSAADVGVSFEDERETRTLVLMTQLYGRVNVETGVQKTARVRNAKHIEVHTPIYDTALPVLPTETQQVLRQELHLKQDITQLRDFEHNEKHTTKLAHTYALKSLAEQQPFNFFKHHLQEINGFKIVKTDTPEISDTQRSTLKEFRREALETERELSKEYALQTVAREQERMKQLKENGFQWISDTSPSKGYKPAELRSAGEIRASQQDGQLTSFNLLGQLSANSAAKTIGFDDVPDFLRGKPYNPKPFEWNSDDLETIKAMILENINPEAFDVQIKGYIASKDTRWITDYTRERLLEGVEWSTVKDYRFVGKITRHLCEKLRGTSHKTIDFATAVSEVLHQETDTGRSFLSQIKAGALGIQGYKKARFLFEKLSDTEHPTPQQSDLYTDFGIYLLERFLPIKVSSQTLSDPEGKQQYLTLQDIPSLNVFEQALNCWLQHNTRAGKKTKKVTIERIGTETEKDTRIAEAVQMKKEGMTRDKIAEAIGLSQGAVSHATKGVKKGMDPKRAKQIAEAKRLHDKGKSYREIGKILSKAPNTIKSWLKST